MDTTGQAITHPLTAIRHARGWTRDDVARIIERRTGLHVYKRRERVYRWEHGVQPAHESQLALAAELGVDPQHLTTHPWPQWLLLAAPDEPTDGAWTPEIARALLSRVVESAAMDRRTFLTLGGGATIALATAWATAAPASTPAIGGKVTEGHVAMLRGRVEQLWHWDDLLGGAGTLSVGLADLKFVQQLLGTRSYSDTVGRQLWSLVAALSRFCGWAGFDAGYGAAAQRLWHVTLRASAAAGERDHGIYALSNMALQHVYADDPRTALAVLDRARTQTDPAHRVVLAMLDTWAARSHAAAGDPRQAVAALNRADDLYNRRTGDDPTWIYWMPEPSATAEAATALRDAGELAAAERQLTTGMAGLPADAARDRQLYLVRLADVQHRAGRLDEATTTAAAALHLGAPTGRVGAAFDTVLDAMPAREPAVTSLKDLRQAA